MLKRIDKNETEQLREYLDSRRSMIIAGINYNPKTKKHECLIVEKMTFEKV